MTDKGTHRSDKLKSAGKDLDACTEQSSGDEKNAAESADAKPEKTQSVSSVKPAMPCDSAFRTLVETTPRLLIWLINEVFAKNYTGNEQVVYLRTEHITRDAEGNLGKIAMDTHVAILPKGTSLKDAEEYHFEAQSTFDPDIASRICTYDSASARTRHLGSIHNTIAVSPPNSLPPAAARRQEAGQPDYPDASSSSWPT